LGWKFCTDSGGFLSSSFVMLNDHNGQVDKWYFGGKMSLGDYHPNECQAVELLPNANSIFINSRSASASAVYELVLIVMMVD
jgi:hypothetical protein